MPLFILKKCPECGEIVYRFLHRCKEKKWAKWEKASPLRQALLMHHPELPEAVRFISFLWLFSVVGGLFFFLTIFLPGEITIEKVEPRLVLFVFVWTILAVLISWGLSHLKRWSLYLFGVALLLILLTGEIWLGPVGLAGFIIVLFHYKKFRY